MLNYPSDFTEDMRRQGICGVLAIAIASRITLAEAHKACNRNKMPHQKRHVRTTYDEQIRACLEQFGRTITEVPIFRQTVRKWVHEASQPNKTYMVFTSGHVMLVKDDLVVDQGAREHYEEHWCKRKFVTQVWEIT